MIRSMTGFAATNITLSLNDGTKVPVSLSLKSLNSRYFDTTCKIPYPLSSFETELIKLFKQMLYRGNITCIIHVASTDVFRGSIEPSLQTIKGYLQAAQAIKSQCNVSGELTIADIVKLPDVFNSFAQELDEKTKQIIFDITKTLIQSLIGMQEAEGVALTKDLELRCTTMEKEIHAIEQAFGTAMVHQKQKVQATMKDLEMDESKLAEAQRNALYTILDKLDINEEIVRFKSHLTAFKHELSTPAIEKGKRLDFILQELGREINTITSKGTDSAISGHAINIKVELEKAREQAQNIV